MEFDEDMEGLEDDMDGMTLADLLSPEEIQQLVTLVQAVVTGSLEAVKKVVEGTFNSLAHEASEHLGKAGGGVERFRNFSHVPVAFPMRASCLSLPF